MSKVNRIVTETGTVFADATAALESIRAQQDLMLDPLVSATRSAMAATEMLYTVRALDAHLCADGSFPEQWGGGR